LAKWSRREPRDGSSPLWAGRKVIGLIALIFSACTWLAGYIDAATAVFIILMAMMTIYFYEWLFRLWHQRPEK